MEANDKRLKFVRFLKKKRLLGEYSFEQYKQMVRDCQSERTHCLPFEGIFSKEIYAYVWNAFSWSDSIRGYYFWSALGSEWLHQ